MLAALHNFIWEYDPEDIGEIQINNDKPPPKSVGELGIGLVTRDEMLWANIRQDQIANAMWEQYQTYLKRHTAQS